MLFRRAVLILEDADIGGRCGMPLCSSGLGFVLFSSFCLVGSTVFSCKKLFVLDDVIGA
jgi:hypothetical protein